LFATFEIDRTSAWQERRRKSLNLLKL